MQTDETDRRQGARWRLSAIPRAIPRAWIWSGGAAVLLFAAWVLAGFTLVPGLIRSQATAWVKTNLDKTLALGEIRFNPLTFTLDISDIALPADGRPMIAAGHLHLNFSVLSLFREAYRFDAVRLDRPFVRAVVRADRSLNLAELIPKKKSEDPAPVVHIGTLSVNAGAVAYADHSRALKPEKHLSPITFELKDFQTNATRGGAFALETQSERGEKFAWKGEVSIAPISSRGTLTVTGLLGETVHRFLSEEMPVVLTGGAASFRADYDFAYEPRGMRLNLALPSVTLNGLALTGKDAFFRGGLTLERLQARIGPLALLGGSGGITSLRAAMPQLDLTGLTVSPASGAPLKLASLSLKGAQFDHGAGRIALDSLTLDGADIPVRRDRNGGINLLAMLPQKPAAAPQTAAPQTPPAKTWQVSLGTFTLNAATLRLEDLAVTPAARITVTPVNISTTGAGSDLAQPVAIRFDARIDGRASVTGEGTVTPGDAAGEIKFTLSKLPLTAMAPYLPLQPGLTLRAGDASASGTVRFKGADLKALHFAGDGALDNFDLRLGQRDAADGRPLFAWQSFAFRGVTYGADRLDITRGRLVRPVGQVSVLADRSFNFTVLTAPAGAAGAAPAPVPVVTAPASAASGAAKPAIAFRMARLDIQRGVMGFADYSIDPNFEARIDEMSGSVSNISNRPGTVAAIDLNGQVIDRFSPATIAGTMDLFGYDRKTDMRVTFRNIELPVFNPYSGRYAGYAIAKGKLTTELHYRIENRALTADHHVVIDQLEWGADTGSKERVPLPVRLATSLLKDRNGVIDLKLPVSGTLDDPKFRIGPIIWQIIGNIIEKVVTAPFELIGSLFAGAEKAQYVDFAPGSAVLPAGAGESLTALAGALAQKPELNLDIPAAPGIREDAHGLADAQIDAQMMAREIARKQPADVAALDMDEQHDRLEDVYRARLGKRPEFPAFPPEALKAASDKAELDDDDRTEILEVRWMRDELRTAFAPGDAQLAALGTARATAVRDALLAGGAIDPARVFMAGGMSASAAGGKSRLELKLR